MPFDIKNLPPDNCEAVGHIVRTRHRSGYRMPFDARLLAWMYFLGGVGLLVIGLLLVAGIVSYPRSEWTGNAFFGLVIIETDFGLGILELISGVWGVAEGYMLIRRIPLGWWFAIIEILYGITNAVLRFGDSDQPTLLIVMLAVGFATLIWLVLRAKVFRAFVGELLSLPKIPSDEVVAPTENSIRDEK